MGYGKQIASSGWSADRSSGSRSGNPFEKLLDCSSKINTGAKYDSEAFKKSVGLNGVEAGMPVTHLTSNRSGKAKPAGSSMRAANPSR